MANAYPTPLVLADGTHFEVGDTIQGDTPRWQRLAQTHNWLIGNLRRDTVGQGWPDGQCSDTTNTRKTNVARWRVPTLPGVTTINVRIRAGASTSEGEVRFTSANSGATLTLNINAAGPAWFAGSLTTAAGAGFDTITMDLTGYSSTAGSCTVYEVGLTPAETASGSMPTAAVGNATPIGEDTLGVDDALPAWVGHVLASNVEAFRDDYPRPLIFWSGLVGLTDTVGGVSVNSQMPAYLHQWRYWANPGAATTGDATVKVHAYCQAGAAGDEHVRFTDDGTGNGPGVEVVTVTGTGWFTGEHSPRERRALQSDAQPFQTHRLYVYPGDAAEGRTDAVLQSLCAWGG